MYTVFTFLLEELHTEFGVVNKLPGATTDNGFNFLKAFRESVGVSTVPTFDDEDLYLDEEEDKDIVGFSYSTIRCGNYPLFSVVQCHLSLFV